MSKLLQEIADLPQIHGGLVVSPSRTRGRTGSACSAPIPTPPWR